LSITLFFFPFSFFAIYLFLSLIKIPQKNKSKQPKQPPNSNKKIKKEKKNQAGGSGGIRVTNGED
jgi:hypothetical protein